MSSPTIEYMPDFLQMSPPEFTTIYKPPSPSMPPLPIFGEENKNPDEAFKASSAPEFPIAKNISRATKKIRNTWEDNKKFPPPEPMIFVLEL